MSSSLKLASASKFNNCNKRLMLALYNKQIHQLIYYHYITVNKTQYRINAGKSENT
jgi:hypothetical protein